MSFKIITDSASNLPNTIIEKEDIKVINLPYFLDGKECSYDGEENFNADEFYALLKEGATVTTSQISPQTYIDTFEPYLKDGTDVLFVGLSSGVSGSFNSACMAKNELDEKYPDRKIRLVDSLGASLGEGMLAIRAAKCKGNGMTLDETFERLEKIKHSIYQVFIVDDVKHLSRTGRLSNAGATVASFLEIRPILKGNEEGKIVSTKMVRGKKKAIKEMAERYASYVKNNQLVCISHGGAREDADFLLSLLNKTTAPIEALIVKHEPATGSHLGPGALALYFEGDNEVRFK